MRTSALLLWLSRLIGLWVLAFVALQLFFAARIASFNLVNPSSTAFERTSFYQNVKADKYGWSHEWVDYQDISVHLKRAVISSEDDIFTQHQGVQWSAIEKAWEKNQNKAASKAKSDKAKPEKPKLIGGSTITQQLAKNLFLSGERTYLRKTQELALVLMLETFLSKQRIYEIYLNHVELGVGVYGMQAGAMHYFKKSAKDLTSYEATRLAVLLPAPKKYQKSFASSEFQNAAAQTLLARMHQVAIP